jgi:hypothetical protein
MDYPCAVPVWRNPLLKGCEFESLELESVVIGMSWCVASVWKRGGAQLTSIEDRTKWNLLAKRRFGRFLVFTTGESQRRGTPTVVHNNKHGSASEADRHDWLPGEV